MDHVSNQADLKKLDTRHYKSNPKLDKITSPKIPSLFLCILEGYWFNHSTQFYVYVKETTKNLIFLFVIILKVAKSVQSTLFSEQLIQF